MSAGTVFTELDLDFSKFEKNQQKLLQSATEASTSVEKNWKNLGAKSDNIFNAMRASAENSFKMIASQSGTSAAEITRAQEAMNAKITAANEAQFGKQTSLLDSLKSNYVAASVAVVAAWAAVNKAVSYMDEGAKALQVESSFKIMAESAGINSSSLIESMKKATKETVDDSDLMQKAVKMMLLDFDAKQIQEFSSVVVTLSQFAGKTVSETFDALGDAIANRTPKALRALGALAPEQLTIFREAVKAGASSTDILALAVANLELKQLQLQGTQDGASISLQRFHAQVKETGETVGKILIVGLREAYAVFQAFGVASLEVSSSIYKVLEARNDFAAAVHFGDAKKEYQDAAAAFKKMAEDDKTAAASLRTAMIDNFTGTSAAEKRATEESIAGGKAKVASAVAVLASYKPLSEEAKKEAAAREAAEKQIIEAIRRTSYEAETIGQTQYEKDVARIKSEAEKYKAAGVGEVTVAKFVAVEMEKANAKAYEEMAKNARAASDEAERGMMFEISLGVKKSDATMHSLLILQNADIAFRAGLRGRAQQWAIDEERLIEGTFTVSADTWDKIGEYQRLTGIKMTETEAKSVDLMLYEYKNTFAGGVKAAFLDLEKNAVTWGNVSYDAVKTFSTEASSAISTYWFDELTGKNKESEENFKATAQQQTADVTAECDKATKAIVDAWKQKDIDIQTHYDTASAALKETNAKTLADIEARYAAGTITQGEAEKEKNNAMKILFDANKTLFTKTEEDKAKAHDTSLADMKTAADEAAKKIDGINTTMNKQIDDLGINWGKVWEGMEKSVLDNLGKMVTDAALNTVVMTFQAAVSGDWSQVLGLVNKGWDLINAVTGSGGAGSVDTNVGDWAANAGGYGGHAQGGPVAPGSPVWVGEQGPELLFPGGPGYVMEHNRSTAYAARNGGFIPGYAGGGDVYDPGNLNIDPIAAWASLFTPAAMAQYGLVSKLVPSASVMRFDQYDAPVYSGINTGRDLDKVLSALASVNLFNSINAWTEYDRTASPYDGGWTATPHTQVTRNWQTGGWLGDFFYPENGGVPGFFKLADAVLSAVCPPWGILEGVAKLAIGAADSDTGMMVGGGMQAASGALQTYYYGPEGAFGAATAQGTDAAIDWAIDYGGSYAKKWALDQIMKYVSSAISGGANGSASLLFTGMEGDLSWLKNGMNAIAPKSDQFAFSAKDGLDYVPRDNFRINAHQGEAVLNQRDATAWRGGVDSGELVKEIRALLPELRAIVRNTKTSARTAVLIEQELNTTGLLTRIT